MLLYTPCEPYFLWIEEKKPEYSYKKVAHCIIEGVKYKEDMVVNRIISTNPKDYLKKEYQIGAKAPFFEGESYEYF